ncbi:hypothetical protein [Candidatus Tisiphia endosymbiont of Mystacides longicornis]|uniref:hypothetical protein n=1 Tax=Candidatus Tisiphia endosymbiont of Mystacides longicornis TaxID=3139330 RepID=UPI003CCB27B2
MHESFTKLNSGIGIISYLTDKNKWLLIFDNLKINENNKVQEFIDWESNGNIIFCSQDSEKLPNTIEMALFDKDTTAILARACHQLS